MKRKSVSKLKQNVLKKQKVFKSRNEEGVVSLNKEAEEIDKRKKVITTDDRGGKRESDDDTKDNNNDDDDDDDDDDRVDDLSDGEKDHEDKDSDDDEAGGDLKEIMKLAETPVKKNSVIDSSLKFENLGLHPQLCEICEKIGYKHPTRIQKESIPVAIEGKDLIGIAETGSGKTASFILPILHCMLSSKVKPSPCSALVLVPTRELAVQIKEHFDAVGTEIGLKTALLVGGVEMFQQQLMLSKNKPHVVVGTPGRICDHLRETPQFKLHNTKWIVLDEADKMLDTQFETELDTILQNTDKNKRHIQLYSATMTKKVEKLQKAHLNDPVKVQIAPTKYTTVPTLKQEYLFIPEKYKEVYLSYLLNENAGKRIMIFVSQNATCITLSIMLRSLGFPAVPVAGHMDDSDRLHCLRKFKSGERPILIGTDVAARGLDIPLVELVINYDIPIHSKEYVHRVGRTARIGKEGRAITIVTQYDIEYFQKIEQLIGRKMEECKTVKDDVMVLVGTVSKASKMAKQRVKLSEMGSDEKDVAGDDRDDEEVLSSAIRQLTKKRQTQRESNKKKKKKKNNQKKE